MRDRTREPTALELALWHHAVREVVRRIERDRPERPAPEPSVAGTPPSAAAAAPEPPVGPARAPAKGPAPHPPARPTPLDRRTLRRLERGHYPIGARLDLHGLRQEAAHDALAGFLARAQAQGHRCVLVITGRGERSGGVLRTSVPRWLAEAPFAQRVLGWAPAARGHGGEGALYLLLRRPKREGAPRR